MADTYDETEEEFQARFEAVRAKMPAGTEPKTMQRKTSDPRRLAAYQAQASLYSRMNK
jgi:hypothetical protein